jgi:hypothetical protein
VTVYVFLGPSLPLDDARRLCDAVFLPPVRLGDVWRAAAFGGARAIGIIDGYFERVPAVWHKEILWALANGVAVAGAASMGALRAAELAPFGMVGVGRICEAYASGVFPPYVAEPFEGDDEVAVMHGPAESGWMSSDAMVNIRATLAAAAEHGVIDASVRDRLAAAAKRLFYQDRSWPTLLRLAERQESPDVLAALRQWLPDGRVDQKRRDAEALLRWLSANPDHVPDARFRFADTALWRRATAIDADADDDRVLMELRLQGRRWHEERDAVLAAILGCIDLDEPAAAALAAADPETGLRALHQRAARHSRGQRAHALAEPLLKDAMLARLRRSGAYAALLARGRAKQERLCRLEIDGADVPAGGLAAWFAARVGGGAPDDPEALAAWLDVDDPLRLLRAIEAEYAFVGTVPG